jgi:hypothetical protein
VQVVEPGHPLVIVEGEFDALLLGHEVAGLASVATLGGASNRPGVELMGLMLASHPWLIATDGDAAGDRAAKGWPARAKRVRPPGNFKDWTEARQASVDVRRWWADRLAGIEPPELFSWTELSAWRWGAAIGDPTPGLIVDRPDPERHHETWESRRSSAV